MKTHGQTKTPEFNTWVNIRQRCYNKNHPQYKDYGGRGILVCDRWLESFENFYNDMGEKPFKKATLERKNTNGNYTPDNCKWATFKEQQNNRRNNRIVEYDGKKQTLQQWADEYNIDSDIVRSRIDRDGWDLYKALTINYEERYIEYDNKKLRLFEWALELNISQKILSNRISAGWSIEKAFKTPIKKRHDPVIEFQNEQLSLSEWSKRLRIDRSVLARRIGSMKWSIEKAFTTPVKRK